MKLIRPNSLFGVVVFVGLFFPCPTMNCRAEDRQNGAQSVNLTVGDAGNALYEGGHTLLRRGRNFELAIGSFRKAVEADSNNYSYHLGLACALTSRAASIGLAESRRRYLAADNAAYNSRLATWRAGQSDASNSSYGKPPPDPPRFVTWDDDKLFDLKTDEAAKKVNDLKSEAISELEAARVRAVTAPQQAEVYYTDGWVISLLRQACALAKLKTYSGPGITSTLLPSLGDLKPDGEVIDKFKLAVAVQPDSADYWRGLGDALIGTDFVPNHIDDFNLDQAIAAYRKSLAIKSSVIIWERLASLCEYVLSHRSASDWAKSSISLTDLTIVANSAISKIIHLDSSNAANYYEEAYIRYLQAKQATHGVEQNRMADSILEAVESGNAASNYVPYWYRQEPPRLLSAVAGWISKMQCTYYYPPGALHESVSTAIHFSLDNARSRQDDGKIMSNCRALISLSYKVADVVTGDAQLDSVAFFHAGLGKSDVSDAYRVMIGQIKHDADEQAVVACQKESKKADDVMSDFITASFTAMRSEYVNQ